MIKLEEMEKLLTECEEDLKKLKAFSKEFKVIEKHRKELENYYKNQYMEDYQKHSNTKEKLRILDQAESSRNSNSVPCDCARMT